MKLETRNPSSRWQRSSRISGVNEETEEMLASTWWRRRRANGAGDDTALGLDVLKTEVIQYSNEPRAKRWREREGRWTMGMYANGRRSSRVVGGRVNQTVEVVNERTSQATKESSYGASTSLQEGGHPVGDILVFSLHVDGRRRRLGWKRGEVVVDDKGGGGNGSSDCHVDDGVRVVGDKAAFGLTNPRSTQNVICGLNDVRYNVLLQRAKSLVVKAKIDTLDFSGPAESSTDLGGHSAGVVISSPPCYDGALRWGLKDKAMGKEGRKEDYTGSN
ncbi:hypothetical protein R3P38DRAFT_3361769 [Favolaschia claudopus]|uniref:Uncharacterized protein n=1 Tax=Favolaschia claudopus TaxID=2862362 RepID=A0AAW0ARU7_9AGAR